MEAQPLSDSHFHTFSYISAAQRVDPSFCVAERYSGGLGIGCPSRSAALSLKSMTVSGLLPRLPSAIFSAIGFLGLPPVPGLGPLLPNLCHLISCRGLFPLKLLRICTRDPRPVVQKNTCRDFDSPPGRGCAPKCKRSLLTIVPAITALCVDLCVAGFTQSN